MLRKESAEDRLGRLAEGPRFKALSELLDELIDNRAIGDKSSHALAMLVIDAALDGDEPSLHVAFRQLQALYRVLSHPSREPTAEALEDRGRALAFLDGIAWALDRSLSLGALAELELDSLSHEFLRVVAEQPGLTNSSIADAISTSDAEVSRLGRRLVDAGLAAKRRLGRKNHWELTPKGLQMLDLLESGGATRFLRPHFQLH